MRTMPKVFISHSTEDREFVENHIVRLLDQNGVGTWYSKDSIMGASRWEREILQGLRQCEWFLVAMSPRAAQSQWVKDEVDWAFSKRRGKIIPILIADCDSDDFHVGMAGIQNIDFRKESAEAKRRLLSVLGISARESTPPPTPAESKPLPKASVGKPPAPASLPDQWQNSLGTFLVRVPRSIWTGKDQELFVTATCVNNREYLEFVNAGGQEPHTHPKKPERHTWDGKQFPAVMAEHPVILVTQADALAFCHWLTDTEQQARKIGPEDTYTLPTQEQWKAFSKKTEFRDNAVVDRHWLPRLLQPTEPVTWGSPSPPGLYCLWGNVFEWCLDQAQKKFRVPGKDGKTETKLLDCFLAIGGGWASSAHWLRQEIFKGTMGGIWCPNGWPIQDGGFRICLVRNTKGGTP